MLSNNTAITNRRLWRAYYPSFFVSLFYYLIRIHAWITHHSGYSSLMVQGNKYIYHRNATSQDKQIYSLTTWFLQVCTSTYMEYKNCHLVSCIIFYTRVFTTRSTSFHWKVNFAVENSYAKSMRNLDLLFELYYTMYGLHNFTT